MSKELEEIVEYRGVEDLVAAEVLTDNNKTGEGYTTGEVFAIAGVAEEKTFYLDRQGGGVLQQAP